MRDSSRERVMRAALEEIAFGPEHIVLDGQQIRRKYYAQSKLIEVDQMPATDTEAGIPDYEFTHVPAGDWNTQKTRAEAAEERLQQIAELLEWVEHEYPASLYPSTRKALRLARGEAAR